jgi:hypothetical protein
MHPHKVKARTTNFRKPTGEMKTQPLNLHSFRSAMLIAMRERRPARTPLGVPGFLKLDFEFPSSNQNVKMVGHSVN